MKEVGLLVGAAAAVPFAALWLAPRRRRRKTPTRCTFDSYAWSTREGRTVDREHVETEYAGIRGDLRSTDDAHCSICEQDQRTITLPGVEPFRVCWTVARQVERALRHAMREGAQIDKVTGYRPGRTGGPLDGRGVRTEFGSHAYGLALDVNPNQNGMYRRGRLLHGGEYAPGDGDPRTITRDSPIYKALRRAGFEWAGDHRDELGNEDWMHFWKS